MFYFRSGFRRKNALPQIIVFVPLSNKAQGNPHVETLCLATGPVLQSQHLKLHFPFPKKPHNDAWLHADGLQYRPISSSVFSRDAPLINSDSLGFVYNAAAVMLYDRLRFSDDSYNRVLSDTKNKLIWTFGAAFYLHLFLVPLLKGGKQ